MLGKILTISKNSATIEINKEANEINDLINLHVVFEDENKKILGEIDSIDQDTIQVTFLGELTENDFIGGLIKKPSLDASVRIINEDELRILTGNPDMSIPLGVSPLYENFPLNVSIDELFSNHTAIFGNTGNGNFFSSDDYITIDEYIKKLQLNENNKKCQIVNFNLEDVDDRFARSIVKLFGRMFMKYTRSLENRASFPIHMILEEAHRYVMEGMIKLFLDIIFLNVLLKKDVNMDYFLIL